MPEYRLYYLDRNSHIVGRDEFMAEDDSAALTIAVSLHEKSDRPHFGLMLWQRARQEFATDEVTGPLVVFLPRRSATERGASARVQAQPPDPQEDLTHS